jgi:hypothetical protein
LSEDDYPSACAIRALTSEDGTVHDADNICCQTGDNYLYVFKGALAMTL